MGKRAQARGVEGTTDFGMRIKRCRTEKKWSQTQLGKKVGVTKGAVSQWERGDIANLKPWRIFKLARLFGREAEWLTTGTGPEWPAPKPEGVSQDVLAIAGWIAALPKERRDLLRSMFGAGVPDERLTAAWTAPKKPE